MTIWQVAPPAYLLVLRLVHGLRDTLGLFLLVALPIRLMRMQAAVRLLFDRPRAYAYPRLCRQGVVVEASEKLTRGGCHQHELSHATQVYHDNYKQYLGSARERLGR